MAEDRWAVRWRVECIRKRCGWKGVRTDYPDDCACYDEWGVACRAGSPGPGCGRGVVWPCPRCGRLDPDPWNGVDRHGSTVRAVERVRRRTPASVMPGAVTAQMAAEARDG